MDYCTLTEVKAELNISSDDNDNMLQIMIEQAKELIDKLSNREFDTVAATARYFDGAGTILFIDDLITIDASGFKLDEDGDGTYEVTLATTDYIEYPLNTTPKTFIKISPNSNYGGFAAGVKKGVQITGTWGYSATVQKAISRASLIQVCRWFKRKDSAYATEVGTGELGTIAIGRGLDPDIELIINNLRKRNL